MAEKIEYLGKTDLLYICQLISSELAKYVTAVSGKQLSTEDFTTALKTKLDGIDLTAYSTTTEMQAAISAAIASVTGIKFVKVNSYGDLPYTGETGTIYLVPKTPTSTNNVYVEYYWDSNTENYEKMGDTSIDLSNYLSVDDVSELTTAEVKAVWDSVFTS